MYTGVTGLLIGVSCFYRDLRDATQKIFKCVRPKYRNLSRMDYNTDIKISMMLSVPGGDVLADVISIVYNNNMVLAVTIAN